MAKEIHRCAPCNFEYEHLYFDTVPRSQQKPVPPCPLCGKALVGETPEITEDVFYRCWPSEDGCGLEVLVEYLKDAAPNTRDCFHCGKTMKKGVKPGSFSIIHGDSMSKGATIDVVIGRDAERRWGNIHDRKSKRDKIREESGTQALSAIGVNEYKPLKGAHIEAVKTPE